MANPVLVIDLRGGVGNALFQYAASLTAAARTGRRCVYSDRWGGGTRRQLENYIGLELPQASAREELRAGQPPPEPNVFQSALGRLVKARRIPLGTELEGGFDPFPPVRHLKRISRLRHLGQHPSIFEESLDVVLNLVAKRFAARLSEVPDPIGVIDLRRGNYISSGFELPYRYYTSAIDEHVKRWKRQVGVVSDDALAVHLFEAKLRAESFSVSEIRANDKPVREEEAFLALARCDRTIMANSTFSWWANVLGDYLAPGKREVVYPEGWIRGHPDVLKRPRWISLRAW